MGTFKQRFPSGEDLLYTFAAVAFPIHVWLIVIVMQEVPAWILRLTLWDLLGVISYDLLFALVETVIVFVGLVLLAAVLPPKWMSRRMVVVSAVILFVLSLWVAFLHYNSQLIERRQIVALALWGISLVAVLAGLLWTILQRPAIEKKVKSFVQQLANLSFLYLFFDVIAIIIVLIR